MNREDVYDGANRAVGGLTPEIPPEQAHKTALVACQRADEQGWPPEQLGQVIDMLGPDVTAATHRIADRDNAAHTDEDGS